MVKQVTLAMLKPSLCSHPDRVKQVHQMIDRVGLKPIMSKKIANWDRSEVMKFYGSHKGRFFYSRLVFTMMNGEVEILALEGENAVSVWRELMGPTHIKKSREQFPMSIRGQFAFSDTKNCVHGSDSISNANEEIQFFFPEYTEMNE